ncbi:MAG: TIGR04084 family radical SAM/SPASM domain-containing protein [Candidatus Eremiobacteraeota bacterium]|nr:TIGR04084 family radical SAM/SPASM domain-containing protein [Candidatus Eremiobacteraeota bacterium]
MYFVIYTTEQCNLRCRYCEPRQVPDDFHGHTTYDFSDLLKYVSQYENVGIQLYGGEPLLNMPLVERIIEELPYRHLVLQTNGLFLERLKARHLERIDVISLSLDGPSPVTDRFRGEGCHRRVMDQAALVRSRGYRGLFRARMTVSPGMDIYSAVMHFLDRCPFHFDHVHWQLNALFERKDWRRKKTIARWFGERYNPGVSRLVEYWAAAALERHRVLHILPFTGIAHTLLTGEGVAGPRCGAGYQMLAVNYRGELYSCPVMRLHEKYRVGTLSGARISPEDLAVTPGAPCDRCSDYAVCGGRCLYANLENLWGREGYELVCASVRHLIGEIRRFLPAFEGLLAKGCLALQDFRSDYFLQTEVIP